MIFNKKKKRMIDVRELQRRGVVRIPKKEISIPTTSEGFVEVSSPATGGRQPETGASQSNANFFGFMDTPSPEPETNSSFSTETDGYNKREVDQKITELDNKIYKLEQRTELLEKKLDVNQPSQKVGPMGW